MGNREFLWRANNKITNAHLKTIHKINIIKEYAFNSKT